MVQDRSAAYDLSIPIWPRPQDLLFSDSSSSQTYLGNILGCVHISTKHSICEPLEFTNNEKANNSSNSIIFKALPVRTVRMCKVQATI